MHYELIVLGNSLTAWQASVEAAWKGIRVALVTGETCEGRRPVVDGQDRLRLAMQLQQKLQEGIGSKETLPLPEQRWTHFKRQLEDLCGREATTMIDWTEVLRVPIYQTTAAFVDHRHLKLGEGYSSYLAGERFLLAKTSKAVPSQSWPMFFEAKSQPYTRSPILNRDLGVVEDIFEIPRQGLPVVVTKDVRSQQDWEWLLAICPQIEILTRDDVKTVCVRDDEPAFRYLLRTNDQRDVVTSSLIVDGQTHVDWTGWKLTAGEVAVDDRGVVWADPLLQTTNPSVYAVPQLTSSFEDVKLSIPQMINHLGIEIGNEHGSMPHFGRYRNSNAVRSLGV